MDQVGIELAASRPPDASCPARLFHVNTQWCLLAAIILKGVYDDKMIYDDTMICLLKKKALW